MLHDAHAPSVAPPGDHAHVADLKLDGLDGLSGLEVNFDGVVNLNEPRTKRDQVQIMDAMLFLTQRLDNHVHNNRRDAPDDKRNHQPKEATAEGKQKTV